MTRNRKKPLFAVAAATTMLVGFSFGMTATQLLLVAAAFAVSPLLAYAGTVVRRASLRTGIQIRRLP